MGVPLYLRLTSRSSGDRVIAEVNGDYEYGATDAQLILAGHARWRRRLRSFVLADRYSIEDAEGLRSSGWSSARRFDGPTWLPRELNSGLACALCLF